LYHLTARENIAFGDLRKNPDDQKISEAAKMADIDEKLKKLPKAYDTNLGRLFEDSQELSVGEWQRLALARAFYRDAPVIILDEPTSSMDAKTEYEIFQKFHELTRDKTSIIISHRFSTVRMADYIFVMKDKSIAEAGTHEELINLNGLYARLFELQASSYR